MYSTQEAEQAEREGFRQGLLIGRAPQGAQLDLQAIAREASALDGEPDDTVEAIQRTADRFHRLIVSPEYQHAQRLADSWSAAFVWPKTLETLTDIVTTGVLNQLELTPMR